MSAVVTTLIIILLAIVAIGIVWVVVKNILDKGSEEITLTGLTLDLEITKASVEGDTLSVTVKRNPGDGNLVGINFVFSDGDNSVVVKRDTTLAELGWQTFTFSLSTLAVGEITSISVAPIFKTSSGKEVTGEIRDTATYSAGSIGSGDTSFTGTPGGDDGGTTPPPDGCTPAQTCATKGFNCDTFIDDCLNTIDCGDCGGGDTCINNICIQDNCDPLDNATACTNAGYECGILSNQDTCGANVNCSAEFGTCPEQHGGNPAWECVENSCSLITYLANGTVDSVWPDTKTYFDTADISDPSQYYAGKYIRFPGSAESECLLISKSVPPTNPVVYDKTIIYLDAVQTDIAPGDYYEIWETWNYCMGDFS